MISPVPTALNRLPTSPIAPAIATIIGRTVKHLDLFSGIGGFAYALDQTYAGGGTIEHIFCDYDKYCRQVLAMHWPESYIYEDIRQITADAHSPRLQGNNTPWSQGKPWAGERIDILTGGFPCQPFSAAGLRRGTADDRHLWPEMLRVILLTEPTWIIAENVRGILTWNDGLVFEQVCSDLEAAGYEVQPFIIPAVAVNAPHRRDRVWFVAHSKRSSDGGTPRRDGSSPEEERLSERDEMGQPSQSGEIYVTDTDLNRPQEPRPEQQTDRYRQFDETTWSADWSEIAAELCSVDDGLPGGLGEVTLTKAQHRKEQLKAYGNAIVPQVAMEIMRAIL